jgi:hypothetical protein
MNSARVARGSCTCARSRRLLRKRTQGGVIVVEFALTILIIFMLVVATLLFGSVLWQYSALCKANNAAARYLAHIPAVEMSSVTKWEEARTTAIELMNTAVEGAGVTGQSYEIVCTPACGGGTLAQLPKTIKIGLWTYMIGGADGGFAYEWFGDYVEVKTEVTVNYGN